MRRARTSWRVPEGGLGRAPALLPFAERDFVGDADELAVGARVVPAGAAEAEEGVGGGADVLVVDHAEGCFVAELAADCRPLLEDRRDD